MRLIDLINPANPSRRLLRAAGRGDLAGVKAALADNARIGFMNHMALFRAVQCGDRSLAEFLIDKGAMVESGSNRCLEAAFMNRDLDMIRMLRRNGAPALEDKDHALYCAMRDDDPAGAAAAKAAGARHDQYWWFYDYHDQCNRRGVEWNCASDGHPPPEPLYPHPKRPRVEGQYSILHKSVQERRWGVARAILDEMDTLTARESAPLILLMETAPPDLRSSLLGKSWHMGDAAAEVIEKLVPYLSAEEILVAGKCGLSADAGGGRVLASALRSGGLEKLDALISAGADIGRFGPEAYAGAVGADDPVAMMDELQRRGISPRGEAGAAPLRAAVAADRADLVAELMRRGAEIDAEQGAALCEAVESGRGAMVRELLDAGADPNAGGSRVIQAAFRNDDTEMLDILAQRGIDLAKLVAEASNPPEGNVTRIREIHLPRIAELLAERLAGEPGTRELPRHKRERLDALREARRLMGSSSEDNTGPAPDGRRP
jgi:ankyrin repeat protein